MKGCLNLGCMFWAYSTFVSIILAFAYDEKEGLIGYDTFLQNLVAIILIITPITILIWRNRIRITNFFIFFVKYIWVLFNIFLVITLFVLIFAYDPKVDNTEILQISLWPIITLLIINIPFFIKVGREMKRINQEEKMIKRHNSKRVIPTQINNRIKRKINQERSIMTKLKYILEKKGWETDLNKYIFHDKSKSSININLDISLSFNDNLVSFIEIGEFKLKAGKESIYKRKLQMIDFYLDELKIDKCFIVDLDHNNTLTTPRIHLYNKKEIVLIYEFPKAVDFINNNIRKSNYTLRINNIDNVTSSDFKKKITNEFKNDKSNYEIANQPATEETITLSELKKILEKGFNKLDEGINVVKEDTADIKSNTTKIIIKLEEMFNSIALIKKDASKNKINIEETVKLIYSEIENNKDVSKNKNQYIKKVKEWFNFWDILEYNSKIFMPGSEFLYEEIKNSDFNDYSPFILYYCRALENELLEKIFSSFHEKINKLTDEEKHKLIHWDTTGLSKKTIADYEKTFKPLLNNIKNNTSNYTLGYIRRVLKTLPNTNKPEGSKRYQISSILQELNTFINDKMGGIDNETLDNIENIVINYRNKAAHVDSINVNDADKFYSEYKKLMNKIISKFNIN